MRSKLVVERGKDTVGVRTDISNVKTNLATRCFTKEF